MGETELQGKKKYLLKLSYLKHDQSRNVSVSFISLGRRLSLAWLANDLSVSLGLTIKRGV